MDENKNNIADYFLGFEDTPEPHIFDTDSDDYKAYSSISETLMEYRETLLNNFDFKEKIDMGVPLILERSAISPALMVKLNNLGRYVLRIPSVFSALNATCNTELRYAASTEKMQLPIENFDNNGFKILLKAVNNSLVINANKEGEPFNGEISFLVKSAAVQKYFKIKINNGQAVLALKKESHKFDYPEYSVYLLCR